MKNLLDHLKREVRRLRDEAGPLCGDDGINTLMDIHDELLRTIHRMESSIRSEKKRGELQVQNQDSAASSSQ